MTPSRTPLLIPERTYLHPTAEVSWTSLSRPAEDLYDEVELLRDKLARAKVRDEQHQVCLEAAHAQLTIVGCYAETCRNHAVAARKKAAKKSGKRVLNEGRGRIITDPEFVAELERVEVARREEAAAKAARQAERACKEVEAAAERDRKDARMLLWECVKLDHEELLREWEVGGRIGHKPARPKRKEVWREFDAEWETTGQEGETPQSGGEEFDG